jgi:hypothetical protein
LASDINNIPSASWTVCLTSPTLPAGTYFFSYIISLAKTNAGNGQVRGALQIGASIIAKSSATILATNGFASVSYSGRVVLSTSSVVEVLARASTDIINVRSEHDFGTTQFSYVKIK